MDNKKFSVSSPVFAVIGVGEVITCLFIILIIKVLITAESNQLCIAAYYKFIRTRTLVSRPALNHLGGRYSHP